MRAVLGAAQCTFMPSQVSGMQTARRVIVFLPPMTSRVRPNLSSNIIFFISPVSRELNNNLISRPTALQGRKARCCTLHLFYIGCSACTWCSLYLRKRSPASPTRLIGNAAACCSHRTGIIAQPFIDSSLSMPQICIARSSWSTVKDSHQSRENVTRSQRPWLSLPLMQF